ncbi:MAG: hypothetical protein Q4B03_00840 [Lachnospiraceae bacterium]|nr:hypothetical protein [Lachnospiraceae bacterium]
MSAKNLDQKGRWRNKTVAFRVSPGEDEVIEAKVRMTGLTKQDYITRRLLENEITVLGNPRVFKGLKDQMKEIINQLERITSGEEVSDDLMEIMRFMLRIMDEMRNESR